MISALTSYVCRNVVPLIDVTYGMSASWALEIMLYLMFYGPLMGMLNNHLPTWACRIVRLLILDISGAMKS